MCGDELKLAQVIRNLLSNALKFTPRLGEVRVHIRCCREQSTFSIEVRDSGPGISQVGGQVYNRNNTVSVGEVVSGLGRRRRFLDDKTLC